MKGLQFALTSNSATMGHKLQGCTVDEILVNNWWYTSNWAYVVLSRVTQQKGLYMRTALDKDPSQYGSNPLLMEMLDKFCQDKTLSDVPEQVLEQMVEAET
jgi:hypothetical protein